MQALFLIGSAPKVTSERADTASAAAAILTPLLLKPILPRIGFQARHYFTCIAVYFAFFAARSSYKSTLTVRQCKSKKNLVDDFLQPNPMFDLREDEWPLSPHLLCVARHNAQVRTH